MGYRLDPWTYESLLIELRKIKEKRKLTLDSFSITPPKVPTLPEEWPSDSVWNLLKLEVICAAYREDVENFLAFYWDIVAKEKGTYRPSKDNVMAPYFPPVPEDPEELNLFSKRYVAAQEVYSRKMLADQIFDGARSTLLPMQAEKVQDLPEETQ